MLSELIISQEKDRSRRGSNAAPPERIQINYSVVKTIDMLPKTYSKVQELYLNHNLIDSLSGIEQFPLLRVLHIKFNFISDLSEFLKIPNKPLLIALNFVGNPAEAQLFENPGFFNHFVNLRSFNASKEASFLLESASGTVSNSGKICKRLNFGEDLLAKEQEFPDGLLTGNFNTKKLAASENPEIIYAKKQQVFSQEILEKEAEKRDRLVSFSSEMGDEEEEDPLEAHISHIDNDICRLSLIFYEKLLKEKAMLGLKRYFISCFYLENKFCKEFHEKSLKNRGFWLWRKTFLGRLLFRNYAKNLGRISENINKENNDFLEKMTLSSVNLRAKKQASLRRITETDQDYIDSNRETMKRNDDENKVLRENTVIINEQKQEKNQQKLGFDEYKEISLRNAKYEKVTEENYRHDLPLSTSFSSKCPYGSI